MKTFAALLMTLAICACAGQAPPPRLVADPAIIPAFPPPPVDLASPIVPQVLRQVRCLQQTGFPDCQLRQPPDSRLSPGAGWSTSAKGPTPPAPKS
jgi:hypothetical protein